MRARPLILLAAAIFGLGAAPARAQDFPPGTFLLDGYPAMCGQAWTTVTPSIPDVAYALPGQILLHPALVFGGAPTGVKHFVYAHECAHQLVGPNEAAADAWAIRIGRGQGWIDAVVLDQICQSLWFSPGDWTHFPGPLRCGMMAEVFYGD
jgi:hypothetical protein